MAKFSFIYEKKHYNIPNSNGDSISQILYSFLNLINKKKENVLFLYKGKQLFIYNKNVINSSKNDYTIFVFDISQDKNKVENTNYIICPKCYNLQLFNLIDDKISLENCVNNHQYKDLSFNDFEKGQMIAQSKINCSICKNNKNLYNNNFYICSCGIYICKLCISEHNFEGHYMIEYNKRYYNCFRHNKGFISYCINCNANLCEICEEDHYKHKIFIYKREKPNEFKIKEMKNEIEDNKIKIN